MAFTSKVSPTAFQRVNMRKKAHSIFSHFIRYTHPFSSTEWQRPIGYLISCTSFFAKEPLIIGLFCGKWPIKKRHPMGLRHPVYVFVVRWLLSRCLTPFTPRTAKSCRSFFAKEPLLIRLFCGKWPVKERHPMGLRHPVFLFVVRCWCLTPFTTRTATLSDDRRILARAPSLSL